MSLKSRKIYYCELLRHSLHLFSLILAVEIQTRTQSSPSLFPITIHADSSSFDGFTVWPGCAQSYSRKQASCPTMLLGLLFRIQYHLAVCLRSLASSSLPRCTTCSGSLHSQSLIAGFINFLIAYLPPISQFYYGSFGLYTGTNRCLVLHFTDSPLVSNDLQQYRHVYTVISCPST